MYLLRLRIYQPQAHYRIPFTYQRRHTYPIPPYSTVIGFLCNLQGVDNQEKPLYKRLKGIKLSIAGCFETKTTEYVWFRNLSKTAHVTRFGAVENRSVNGRVEHIGGQSPVLIDILNEVRLVVYLAHQERAFLESVRTSLLDPVDRLEVLHLGRAEDWIVVEELSDVFELSNFTIQRVDANFEHFFWIPEKICMDGTKAGPGVNFEGFDGLLYNIPSFSKVEDFDKYGRHGQRVFDYVRTKLNDGLMVNRFFLYDEKVHLPIFLADFGSQS
jgi:CRISPR-associated protein Cas5t